MRNREYLDMIKQGGEIWDVWKKQHRTSQLLRNSDFAMADLSGVNLSGLDLSGATFYKANLTGADLRSSIFVQAYLMRTNFSGANLFGASLEEAYLNEAILEDANLTQVNLRDANFTAANFTGVNLTGARAWGTHFANVDLRTIKGLTEIIHQGPSHIDLHTIQLPQDGSALHFLRGTGVPDEWIDFWRSTMMHPVQYHSLFISYSSKDETLARRLHAGLQAKGVRCWFAPEDLKIGDKIRPRIDEAIHLQDKLLLLLSWHAIASDWVADEVEAAIEKEQRQKREVLFPVRLDDAVMQTTQAWAAKLRRTRHIGDFTNWTDLQAYQQALDRLLRDLKKADERQDQEMKQ